MSDPRHQSLIAAEVCLGRGVHAVEAVEVDGTVGFWLLGAVEGEHGSVRGAVHEALGPLPYAVRVRIWGVRTCGAPGSTTGRPCGRQVSEVGVRCRQHRVTS